MLLSLVFREAFRVILRNKMRSTLTVLGITIGIAAVICVVAIGQATSRQYEDQLRALGDNLIWVEAGGRNVNGVRTGTRGTKTLLVSDAQAILTEVPLIKRISPQVDGRVSLVFGNQNWNTTYRGESPDYLEIRRWTLASGTNISQEDVDQGASVCVLANTVREQLFGSQDAVGKFIKVNSFPCRVIGVLTPKGSSVTGQDQDDFILVPYTMAQKKLAGHIWLDDIMCSAASQEAIPEATQQIMALMRERHRVRPDQEDDFNIRSPQDLINAGIEAAKTFSMLLVSIASIALLVGGIGIMNVMLVSVTERTREIGVRMAIGATDTNIQLQFLGEAIVLSLFGGLCGVVLGTAASYIIGSALDWPMAMSGRAILIATLFALLVGAFFGFYPARKASQMDPIEALRFE